ncbi:pre-mRNA cleavage complex II family protein [Babesia ovis]|uniref:Pre-mRNA cleavage complex II family protein n=1 Tax=Babesia ovis TaxID=5869 RepID=A0A9W5TB65_BABOV|nr:pre-mRNA cleavage complex II family protein [Babesia ovis]
MQQDLRYVNAAEQRRRRAAFRHDHSTLQGRIDQDAVGSHETGDVYAEVIALRPGEYLALQRAFHFRVLRGAVEFNGHVYTPRRKAYTKALIPPWLPPERMVALCSNGHDGLDDQKSSLTKSGCEQCRRIITQNLLGGACCDIVQRLKEDAALMEKHFCIRKAHYGALTEHDDPDYHIIELYNATKKMPDNSTLVSFIRHTSAFGSVAIRSIFVQPKATKIILPQLINAARAVLTLCTKGDRLPVLMLHGDKSAGKSTSVMYIVNYLLNHVNTVAVLDTDVGQPIFGPPGTVSLKFVGEPINSQPHALVCQNGPDVIYLLGDIKVTNPVMMLRFVYRCFSIYASAVGDDRSVPLVVNTFGWISGMGAKLLESIAAITRVAVMLKLNSKHLNGATIPVIKTHRELEEAIKDNLVVKDKVKEPSTDLKTEVFSMYTAVVEECGATLPWNTDSCRTVEALSHSQARKLANEAATSLQHNSTEDVPCRLSTWTRFHNRNTTDSDIPSTNDLRWLRACAILHGSFGDAMHFPQLHPDEFFGAVKTATFRRYIRHPQLFKSPKQLLLTVDSCSFVLQISSPPGALEEVCPVIAGSMVALCRGDCNQVLTNEISESWDFISYVYVHYLNADDMTMLISHSRVNNPQELSRANIVVVCQAVGLDTIPTRLFAKPKYDCMEALSDQTEAFWRPRELSTSQVRPTCSRSNHAQFVPFRRNNLLHMINTQGAGTSSGNSRKNIKRHKQEVKHD